jgi:hypothetical protein
MPVGDFIGINLPPGTGAGTKALRCHIRGAAFLRQTDILEKIRCRIDPAAGTGTQAATG